MKHHSKIRKLGRTRNVRKALIRSLAEALVISGKIKTTEAKAKELRPFIEKLVTKAKKGDLASTRAINSKLGEVSGKLIKEIAPRYATRAGGYTRIIKMSARPGDGSPMAIIEFVS
ncbi:MAG: 50S ribosomal protein L17 [Candidatus Vogelbacteria bacterium]|nr:50S ribosomal protein L17 [Candidatus Vogelbacteria bacterium]